LIALIIDARNISAALVRQVRHRTERSPRPLRGHGILIGQIKLTRIHEFRFLSPGCGSSKEQELLFTMSKDRADRPWGRHAELLLFDLATGACSGKVETTFPLRTGDHSRTWSMFRKSGDHFSASNRRPLKDLGHAF